MVVPKEYGLLLFMSYFLPVSALDYCSDVKCPAGMHTMCKYPDTATGEACGDLGGEGFTDDEIEELLSVHNRQRNHLASGNESRSAGGIMPPATNMGALTWNNDLAEVAQRWASQCIFGPDQCRNLPHMMVGQNVVTKGSTSKKKKPLSVTALLMILYLEITRYNAKSLEFSQYTHDTGHFTQWAWANTYHIGCGYSTYYEGKFFTHYAVCNYAPAGNIQGQQLYEKGKPCSACPRGSKCGGDSRYPYLCSAIDGVVPKDVLARFTASGQSPAIAAPGRMTTHFARLLVLLVITSGVLFLQMHSGIA